MVSLDTNILVRYMLDDDPVQSSQVHHLFETAEQNGEQMFVPVTVFLEIVWVLGAKKYALEKSRLSSVLQTLLCVRQLQFQHQAALVHALSLFIDFPKSGFADCLHIALARHSGEVPLLTFDLEAAKLPDALAVVGS